MSPLTLPDSPFSLVARVYKSVQLSRATTIPETTSPKPYEVIAAKQTEIYLMKMGLMPGSTCLPM
jgi:hypothetical protein